jgi:proteic killer suppression protein
LPLHNATRYNADVIKSFQDIDTEKVWLGEWSKHLPAQIQPVARRKLRMLNNARDLTDLRVPPANQLERLKGRRRGQYSIRINDQWRVCFVWSRGDAYDVEIVDYHR